MSESRRNAAAKEKVAVSVRITQQFRERNNMTYELDCCGVPLVLRIFFPVDAQWRIEASSGLAPTAWVATASALSRTEAMQALARNWRNATPATASNLDWTAVECAMVAVRAI